MFGLVSPCTRGNAARAQLWQSQLCGLCLGLRDTAGQPARATTNTDAVVLGVLVDAQSDQPSPTRTAASCALRGMRRAQVPVATSPAVRLGATASLLLAAATVDDKVADRDGFLGMPLIGAPARRIATGWEAAARTAATGIGLDDEPIRRAVTGQADAERSPSPRLDDLTAAASVAAGELFGHSAVLANKPENVEPLRRAGREFGLIAHLVDAVEDHDDDLKRGAFNPLTATGATRAEAVQLLREAHQRLTAAVDELELRDPASVHWLLVDEVAHAIARSAPRRGGAVVDVAAPACASTVPAGPAEPWDVPRPRSRLPLRAGAFLAVYCTGYACCCEHTNPCSGKRHRAGCRHADCCSACDLCDCP